MPGLNRAPYDAQAKADLAQATGSAFPQAQLATTLANLRMLHDLGLL